MLKNMTSLSTGCDRGFGRQLARRLDSLGFKVFAGCLYPEGEDIQDLKDTVSSNIVIMHVDVTKDESVQKALETVRKGLGSYELWAIVNNAGVIERGELEWMPLELYKKQFEVNTFGVVRVTQAFLPLLRKSKGRVVTITSVGGRHTFSGFACYCMSKHAVSSFCDGLRLEMKKFGVDVITVEPFSYSTSMTEMEIMLKSVEGAWKTSSLNFQNDDVYDEEYIEAFSDSVRKFNEATQLMDTNDVIHHLVEAVCAISPHYSYVPGDLIGYLRLWLSKRGPKSVVDYFTRKFITFDCDLEDYLEQRALPKKKK